MKTQIKGRNVTVTDALQQYANEKIEHVHKLLLQRKIDEVTRVELELQVEKNPSIPEPCIAEATVFTRGPVIRARESSTDMYAAIDLVSDKLVRRVKKYHDKAHGKTRHGHDKLALPVEPDAELAPVAAALLDEFIAEDTHAGDNGRVVKTKQFALKPMSVHEATLQMELVGHDFFVFTNAESSRTNVVYRRNDGHYGLIEPAEN
ncbi:MAG TPA: ribosome-associated translation inhibitor RaiA [Thermoleophilia bacterium]|nr:ribosome-associated translation inhibitor RaiA [Thermoleophilia bacterium]